MGARKCGAAASYRDSRDTAERGVEDKGRVERGKERRSGPGQTSDERQGMHARVNVRNAHGKTGCAPAKQALCKARSGRSSKCGGSAKQRRENEHMPVGCGITGREGQGRTVRD